MTPAEYITLYEARLDYALLQRRWADTMAANIAVTLIRLKGGDINRDDLLTFSYPEAPVVEEVAEDDVTVSILKQWVAVTKKVKE
jgi:hypothetical protein